MGQGVGAGRCCQHQQRRVDAHQLTGCRVEDRCANNPRRRHGGDHALTRCQTNQHGYQPRHDVGRNITVRHQHADGIADAGNRCDCYRPCVV